MAIEGELIVRLDCDDRRIRKVGVQSTRPMIASRVLKGMTPTAAAATVPLLFSLCGGAQGAAAEGALAAAGATGFGTDSAYRDRELLLEALQETFWHLLIDWPNSVGGAPSVTAVAAARFQIASATRASDGAIMLHDAAAMRTLASSLAKLAGSAVYGMAPAAWLELADVVALRDWAVRGETVPAALLGRQLAEMPTLGAGDVALMPAASCETLRSHVAPALLADPAFVRAPTWDGVAVETGALARMRAHPLVAALMREFGRSTVTRIVARLVELALLLGELAGAPLPADVPPRAQSIPLGVADGLAAVMTARGLLLHRVRLQDERIADYQIVAPTEWNFHPAGALVRGLEGHAAANEAGLLRDARLAVHALDPCVACRVEVGHA